MGRFRLPTPKPMLQRTLLQDYPYAFLGALFLISMMLGKVAGMSLWDAFILGAWTTSLVYFAWQVVRYRKYRANPEAAARQEAAKNALAAKKAKEAKKPANGKATTAATRSSSPKIAVVPRKPAQRVPVRKPGMNVKPQPQTDETPKT
jgi:hypothetical protein